MSRTGCRSSVGGCRVGRRRGPGGRPWGSRAGANGRLRPRPAGGRTAEGLLVCACAIIAAMIIVVVVIINNNNHMDSIFMVIKIKGGEGVHAYSNMGLPVGLGILVVVRHGQRSATGTSDGG
jgi:hypothetical protein